MAGILPLNYARERQNRLWHAIIEGYASRSSISRGAFQAVVYPRGLISFCPWILAFAGMTALSRGYVWAQGVLE